MNKAFVREPDSTAEYCPRCGSKGEPVGSETLQAHLPEDKETAVSAPANFCPSAKCEVVYFDVFERVVMTSDLSKPVYPKDPAAPVCACFGLTEEDIERDARTGATARVKAVLEKAKSPEARCAEMAVNGRPCTYFVQRYFLQCLQNKK